ncbi:PREDICTED: uncharacterized protein LOC109359855 [Lupinus angustifolius]|uniref:uncharacterized protein LOC109359855 n=1 Tax=Lupinus angustifolius TaxID=3871 RepID=UPI00092FBD19|nr:PREDICTED: uncharacterized protein LOC109359855 [Lupinus angustifolius]
MFDMRGCNAVKNLGVPSTRVSKDVSGARIDETLFKQVVGSLMYLTVTRSDLVYSVSLISRFMSSPTMSHWLATKIILRYLRGTIDLANLYKKGENNLRLTVFTNSNYAGDLDDRKSTSRFVFMMGSAAFLGPQRNNQCFSFHYGIRVYSSIIVCLSVRLAQKGVEET